MKCKVDILIINALVVTMDKTGRIMPRAAVAVDRETILEIGDSGDLEARYEAGTTIDASDAIVIARADKHAQPSRHRHVQGNGRGHGAGTLAAGGLGA